MIKVQTPVLLNERETEREKEYHGPEENNIYKHQIILHLLSSFQNVFSLSVLSEQTHFQTKEK
jgi:hypothetical protein